MKVISLNRKALHDYSIDSTLEAGIVLCGHEVKSIRNGLLNLVGSFATINHGELFLINCYIGPYANAALVPDKNDTTRRSRKLLVHKRELLKITGLLSRRGVTLIPLKVYINDKQKVKVELGIAHHKKAHTRKEELRERDIRRETARELKLT